MNEPTRADMLELDIDLRLVDLWREADLVAEWDTPTVAAFLRAAYGLGYVAALVEPNPGHLATDHGYRIPERRAA